MKVLVTGAAGFIGSTTTELLLDEGHEVVALDSLASGVRDNVPTRASFVEGDCGDVALVASLGPFEACVHFAGRIEPGASMDNPEVFFANNVGATFRLVETLVAGGLERFVFSSSCAVYGDRVTPPIDEDHPVAPHSPYGQSKLMVEEGLGWLVSCGKLRAAALRYFNAAGATARHRERHRPEIHLIPLALDAAAGLRPYFEIFGEDYPTPDGTCIRDYVHVSDLASAHVLALGALRDNERLTLNLGTGVGHSNRQVLAAARRVTGVDFEVRVGPRRPGDPAIAVADNARALSVLGWRPQYSQLDTMVADAWAVHPSRERV